MRERSVHRTSLQMESGVSEDLGHMKEYEYSLGEPPDVTRLNVGPTTV